MLRNLRASSSKRLNSEIPGLRSMVSANSLAKPEISGSFWRSSVSARLSSSVALRGAVSALGRVGRAATPASGHSFWRSHPSSKTKHKLRGWGSLRSDLKLHNTYTHNRTGQRPASVGWPIRGGLSRINRISAGLSRISEIILCRPFFAPGVLAEMLSK